MKKFKNVFTSVSLLALFFSTSIFADETEITKVVPIVSGDVDETEYEDADTLKTNVTVQLVSPDPGQVDFKLEVTLKAYCSITGAPDGVVKKSLPELVWTLDPGDTQSKIRTLTHTVDDPENYFCHVCEAKLSKKVGGAWVEVVTKSVTFTKLTPPGGGGPQ